MALEKMVNGILLQQVWNTLTVARNKYPKLTATHHMDKPRIEWNQQNI